MQFTDKNCSEIALEFALEFELLIEKCKKKIKKKKPFAVEFGLELADVVGGDVGDFEDVAGLAAELLLGARLVDDDVALLVPLAARLLQLRARHRQAVLGAVQLVSSRLVSSIQIYHYYYYYIILLLLYKLYKYLLLIKILII